MMSSEQINQEIQRLLNIRVADTTLIVYKRAYDEYLKYCTKRRLPISTAAEIDWALAHYLAYLSLTGQPKSRAHMAFGDYYLYDLTWLVYYILQTLSEKGSFVRIPLFLAHLLLGQ